MIKSRYFYIYFTHTSMTQCIVFISTSLHNKALHLGSREGQPAAVHETERFKLLKRFCRLTAPLSRSRTCSARKARKQRGVLLAVKWNVAQSQIWQNEKQTHTKLLCLLLNGVVCVPAAGRQKKEEEEAAAEEVATKIRGEELQIAGRHQELKLE